MKATIELELMPFLTPNYVRTKRGDIETLDDTAIKLADLSENTLNEMCDEFRDAIMTKAGYAD